MINLYPSVADFKESILLSSPTEMCIYVLQYQKWGVTA